MAWKNPRRNSCVSLILRIVAQQVDIIWKGDITDFRHAYELNCIVDQVQFFAATKHRQIVIKHLESWLQYAESLNSLRSPL